MSSSPSIHRPAVRAPLTAGVSSSSTNSTPTKTRKVLVPSNLAPSSSSSSTSNAASSSSSSNPSTPSSRSARHTPTQSAPGAGGIGSMMSSISSWSKSLGRADGNNTPQGRESRMRSSVVAPLDPFEISSSASGSMNAAHASVVAGTVGEERSERRRRAAADSDKVVVCVRVKPPSVPLQDISSYDLDRNKATLTLTESHPNVIKRGGKAGREGGYVYNFDELHLPPASSTELYERRISSLVEKAMQGYNSTIFAYGQTGSGKTHTMTGTEDEVGIIPLAIAGVFEGIEANPGKNYLLRVSYLEIYNEQLRDILQNPKKVVADEKPAIHLDNGEVVVRPLAEEIVKSPEDVMSLLKKGQKNRKTGATDWNERSSRSHCVFTMTIESDSQGQLRRSKLTLIDLAGSEKAASNLERLAEGKHINKSLLALGTVIEQLADPRRKPGAHIGFRNSKLTHILENSIGGNANVAVICTLSLDDQHTQETLETLKFAQRCSQVETKAVQGFVASDETALLRAKEEEIAALRAQLAELNRDQPPAQLDATGSIDTISRQDIEALELRRDRLVAQLSSLNGQILSSQSSGPNTTQTKSRFRRRVSDLARGLTPPTPSRRVVSGSTLSSLDEESDSGIGYEMLRAATSQAATTEQALKADLASSERENKRLQEECDELRRQLANESSSRTEAHRLLEIERERGLGKDDQIRSLMAQVKDLQAEQRKQETLTSLGLPTPVATSTRHDVKSTGSLKERRIDPITHAAVAIEPGPSRDQEEIERLKTVIEGQKSVEKALRENIGEWMNRVTRQNEIIEEIMRTGLDTGSPRTPTKSPAVLTPSRVQNLATPRSSKYPSTLSPRRSYGKEAPSPSATDYSQSPRPLPIPDYMDSPSRSRRRVTIEHDLDRLKATKKVDSTRNVFAA